MLDLTKAFESVDREMAWQMLLSKGAPPKPVTFIQDLHTQHSAFFAGKLTLPQSTQMSDSSKDVCFLHALSVSVLTQSLASHCHSCSALASPPATR